MTESKSTCPDCGAALTKNDQGAEFCAACLLRQGLEDTLEESSVDSGDSVPAISSLDFGDAEPSVPKQIGSYRVLSRLGEGGMGVVYLAEQTERLQRKVAIKLVKVGVNSKQVLSRFQLEQQSLALMDHPYIARIFDAGTSESGQPYFVMEYIEGQTITEFCDQKRLTNRDRITLFRKVCQAVQHAHHKGVIHRDLKPSNIMVVETEDGPEPRIIDFGVAKATEKRFLEWSVFTEVGRLIGTPEYMSPEQAGDSEEDVDTRTDVYSLGVVLYELLVGRVPIDASELRARGLNALLRMIRESTFPTPSSRAETLGELTAITAENRQTDSSGLRRQLRGDLDWIVMRALEKDKDRRYATPQALGEELRRYLEFEPVRAGPPGLGYQLKKFVKRHGVAVATVATIFGLTVVGLAVTTWLWRSVQEEHERVERLSDFRRLEEYRQEASSLWPATPEKLPQLRSWLDERALPLVARLPEHQRTLEELREQALPYGDEDFERDRVTHPLYEDLVGVEDYMVEVLDRIDATSKSDHPEKDEIVAHYESKIEPMNAEIARLKNLVDRRRTWKFVDTETKWRHEMLTELVAELRSFDDPDPFAGDVASVRKRIRFAEGVAENSFGKPELAKAWDVAIAEIQQDPRFDGLILTPQLGLVPLGKNPASGLWEFWHFASGERPQTASKVEEPGETIWDVRPETGMVFVLLPGGEFSMGAQANDPNGINFDPQAARRESNIHTVELLPFFMSKYETTQGQWLRLAGNKPSRYGVGSEWDGSVVDGSHPVEMISWTESKEMLWRHGLQLPTESQWEYAARAGTDTPWWTGSDVRSIDGAANVSDRHLGEGRSGGGTVYETWLDDGFTIHAPVGHHRANGFGMHNMIANVEEWCRDFYQSPYRTKNITPDGYRMVPGGTSSHVVRGGGWQQLAQNSRVSARGPRPPHFRSNQLGIRAVRPLDEHREQLILLGEKDVPLGPHARAQR